MSKRSNFIRRERDYYPTPAQAIPSLTDHLEKEFPSNLSFAEPCAGDGQLVRFLEETGLHCCFKSDIEPQADDIQKIDAMRLDPNQLMDADMIVTNPPWRRDFLHDFIFMCVVKLGKPTWLLFDSDWIHTLQAKKTGLLNYLSTILSVGRLKWIPDSKHSGKDNCQWHYFIKSNNGRPPKFYGRILDDS